MIKSIRLLRCGVGGEEEIVPGNFVKVSDGRENFWVQVVESEKNQYIGIIMNTLMFARAYSLGTLIRLQRDHILEIKGS